MELLAAILTICCTFYIFKNVFVILIKYIGRFVFLIGISRSEDGNQFITLISTLFFSLVLVIFMLFFSYKIFKELCLLPIIAISLYFRFGTDAGK
ncbi:hypothetical protein A4G25_12500 [Staphylococcus condimenti]|nr:hypothetical protein A4G25_12500 [Staphylococcus condimenti]